MNCKSKKWDKYYYSAVCVMEALQDENTSYLINAALAS